MENYCLVCKQECTEKFCPNCGFMQVHGEASLSDIWTNQMLLSQRLLEIQQKLNGSKAQKKNKIITVLAGIVKPLKIKLKDMIPYESVNRMNSFFHNYLKRGNASLSEQLTKVSALRLKSQKKQLKTVPFFKLDGALTNLSVQHLMERQRILFSKLVEEEKDKIKEELEERIRRIKEHKRSIHSEDFKMQTYMPRFSDLLILFSGANLKYLEQCPNERQKFLPIGLSIFVTTLLATISMYYAASLIFGGLSSNNHFFVVCFSLFWGLAIFSIDWGLIKTMRKTKKERPFLLKLLTVPVLFRLAVAVLISYSISRPLEIAIYEKRLKAQIEMDQQAFIRQETERMQIENKKIAEPLDSVRVNNTKIAEIISSGPKTITYSQNIAAHNACNEELESLTNKNNSQIAKLRSDIRFINNSPKYRDTVNYQLTEDALNLISKKKRSIYSLGNEINNKKVECQAILAQINSEAKAHRDNFASVEKQNSQVGNILINQLSEKLKSDSTILSDIKAKAKISFDPDNPGLITSLESLANFEKTPEGQKVWIVRLILLLIFICIDTAPIIVKLLTKWGPYEELQEADEEKMRYLATAEKNANMLLISNIATAQNRVLRLAIDQYAKEELDKLKNEASYYENFVNNGSLNNREE